MRSVPVALEWGARSVDHLSRHPPRRRRAARRRRRAAAVLLPGAELMNAEHTAAGARAGRRRRDLRARHRLQPRHLADRLDAGDHRPRGPALRLERARGAARRRRSTPPTCSAGRDELGSLEPGKRADVIVLDGPAEHVPYRFGHNPVAVVIARRRARAGCAPTRPGGCARDRPAAELRDRLAGLEPIGLGADGTTRLAWTPELAAAEAWFARAGRAPRGCAWSATRPARCGRCRTRRGRGGRPARTSTASAAAAATTARWASRRASRSPSGCRGVAVIAFADEEGARFNTPTFGSRALVGRLDVADVLARRDDDGVALADAMRAAGADPGGLADAPAWLAAAARLRRAAHRPDAGPRARSARPPAPCASLASRMRLALTFAGRADHAGTTRRGERRDALAAAARLIVAADELAGDDPDFLVTAARMLVEPNAFTTVPSGVRLWIDGRTPDAARASTAWRDGARPRAPPSWRRRPASRSRSRPPRTPRASRSTPPCSPRCGDLPELVCFAGHDAGHPRPAHPRRHGLRPQRDRRQPRPRGARRARRRRRRRHRPAHDALERLA